MQRSRYSSRDGRLSLVVGKVGASALRDLKDDRSLDIPYPGYKCPVLPRSNGIRSGTFYRSSSKRYRSQTYYETDSQWPLIIPAAPTNEHAVIFTEGGDLTGLVN